LKEDGCPRCDDFDNDWDISQLYSIPTS
jgi:hypothetical protein